MQNDKSYFTYLNFESHPPSTVNTAKLTVSIFQDHSVDGVHIIWRDVLIKEVQYYHLKAGACQLML